MADKSAPKLSLYANLLNPSAATALSSEPVLYKKEEQDAKAAQIEAARQKLSAGTMTENPSALRFQPTIRSQIQSKPKPKVLARPITVKSSSSPDKIQDATSAPAQPVNKTTLADWTVEPEDGDFYAGQRIRGGRKNKKRKKNKQEAERPQWDDIYDPTRPTSFEEYKHSEESAAEMNEWINQLYAHRRTPRSSVSSEREYQPAMNKQFAPPSSLSFAPPTSYDGEPSTDNAQAPENSTDDDPYARRTRMSGIDFAQPKASSPTPPYQDIPTSGPPVSGTSVPLPPPQSAPRPPAPAFHSATVLSSAPVRYNMPAASPDLPTNQQELDEAVDAAEDEPMEEASASTEAPRTNRPGQAGFAERLLMKYGWSKGQGLGASGDGITTALSVKVDKRKKKSDAEGGGFRNKGAMGKIIGGKRKKGTEEEAGMSTVVVCTHMVDGMDLDFEMGPEGNLVEEIGQECAKLYGRLEQVKVFRESTKDTIPVFLRFTEPVSALRAVSALQGKLFAGNTVTAKFYDEDLFKDGIYE